MVQWHGPVICPSQEAILWLWHSPQDSEAVEYACANSDQLLCKAFLEIHKM